MAGIPFGHRRSDRRRAQLVALLVLAALLAAACGRSESDSDSAADTSTPVGDASVPAASSPAADASATTEVVAAAGLDAGGFGDLEGVCSEGDATPVEGVRGIDGTTINVGTFADVGFVGIPGLNQEFFDTADAVIEWCNSHGGVRGYTLASNKHDSALTEYATEMVRACDGDFFVVGGGGVLDDTGQPPRLECGLPEMSAFSVAPGAANADILLTTLPNPVDQLTVSEQYYAEQRWPDSLSKTAVITLSDPSTMTVRDRYLEYFDQTPWEVAYSTELNALGETSYAPFVQAMKEADVEIVSLVATEASYLAEIQQAAANLEFEPTAWIVSTNIYDPGYIELAGENAKNTFTRSIFWPVEKADENPATADYLELLADGEQSILGMQAMSSWMLFLTSLGACADAGNLTRDCVYQEGAKQTSWTGGGLHGPLDVTHESAPGCAVIVEATPDGFMIASDQELNEDGFNCDAPNVAPLTGDYGEGARCPSGDEDPLPSTCA